MSQKRSQNSKEQQEQQRANQSRKNKSNDFVVDKKLDGPNRPAE